MLYAINPQAHGLAIATFTGNHLDWAGYIRGPSTANAPDEWSELAHMISVPRDCRLVIEQMRVYPGPQQKGDQNDLITLASVVGAVCALPWSSRRIVYPREWKGTVDKKIMRDRIESRLTAFEKEGVCDMKNQKLRLDVWDAVGIGLFDLGRLHPRRIITRGKGT